MLSTRWAWTLSVLLVRAVVAEEGEFTFPVDEGMTFFQDDTVIVSWDTTIANMSLWFFCWEQGDDGKDVLTTKLHVPNAADNIGSERIEIDYSTDSDNCWFNFRDNESEFGVNGVRFSLNSTPQESQTTWKLSDDAKEDESETSRNPSSTTKTAAPRTSQATETTSSKLSITSETISEAAQTRTSTASEAGSTLETLETADPTGVGSPDIPEDGAQQGDRDPDPEEEEDNKKLSMAAKAGIIVGVAVIMGGILALGIGWYLRWRRRALAQPSLMAEAYPNQFPPPGHAIRPYNRPTYGGQSKNGPYMAPGGHYNHDVVWSEMDTLSHKSTPSVTAPAPVSSQYPPTSHFGATELPTRYSHRLHNRDPQELAA